MTDTEQIEGLHSAGVMDKHTMREFDDLCLTPVRPLSPNEIRALRLRERASQAVFARYLNVTTGLVSQWEARGKAAAGSLSQAPDPCREARTWSSCLIAARRDE